MRDYRVGDSILVGHVEIRADQFVSKIHNKLDEFLVYWNKQHIQDPEDYPSKLSEFEFCNQFTIFCNNKLE